MPALLRDSAHESGEHRYPATPPASLAETYQVRRNAPTGEVLRELTMLPDLVQKPMGKHQREGLAPRICCSGRLP